MSDENKMRDVSWHQYSEMCKIAEQAEAENQRLTKENADLKNRVEHQQQAMNSLAKRAADLNSREGYLVKLINRAYNCKEWCECLDTLEPVVKESNDAK